MLEFIKSMYPPKKTEKDNEQQNIDFEDNPLPQMIEQISQNLEKKYEETMTKLIEQNNQPKEMHPSSAPFKKGAKFEKKAKFNPEEKTKEKVYDKKK